MPTLPMFIAVGRFALRWVESGRQDLDSKASRKTRQPQTGASKRRKHVARLACVQTNVAFNLPEKNRDRLIATLQDLAQEQVEMAVFPEAYLTGYVVDSPEQAREIAIEGVENNRNIFDPMRKAVEETGVGCVFGFVEREGETLYNTAVMLEPGQATRIYRKAHLPHLGYDRYATGGDQLPVFETCIGRVGLQICYDLRMPEATRVQALAGAEVILLPTNWPVGAEINPELYMRSRAAENRVYILSANRVGNENGTEFIGRSSVVDMGGNVLKEAGAEEAVLVVDIAPERARDKKAVKVPGKYEMDLFGTRRPELYARICH